MSKKPTTACHACGGSGQVEIAKSIAKTLESFGARSRFTAADLRDSASGHTANAINNRLEKLRQLGLLVRERDGRAWRYRKPKSGEVVELPDASGEPKSDAAPKPKKKAAKRKKAVDA